MRSRVLALVAVVLAIAGLSRRWARAHEPAPALSCAHVVAVESDSGVRIACPDDAALASCGKVREGVRYRGCDAVGVVPGPILAAHGQPIDANRASADDLRAIPNVGPSVAKRIVEARQGRSLCGPEDLDAIPGLGPKKVDALAQHLWFDPSLCAGARAQ